MDVQSICNFFKEMRNCLFDVQKWHKDLKIEQVVLRMSILIWEMYQSDWEKISHIKSFQSNMYTYFSTVSKRFLLLNFEDQHFFTDNNIISYE